MSGPKGFMPGAQGQYANIPPNMLGGAGGAMGASMGGFPPQPPTSATHIPPSGIPSQAGPPALPPGPPMGGTGPVGGAPLPPSGGPPAAPPPDPMAGMPPVSGAGAVPPPASAPPPGPGLPPTGLNQPTPLGNTGAGAWGKMKPGGLPVPPGRFGTPGR